MKLTKWLISAASVAMIAMPLTMRAQDSTTSTDSAAAADANSADSLFRAGRDALNGGDNPHAAALFAELVERFEKSSQAAEGRYWQAFALFNTNDSASLRPALGLLQAELKLYPDIGIKGDVMELATRIRAKLAQGGDSAAAAAVTQEAHDTAAAGAAASADSTAQPPRDSAAEADSTAACDRVDSRVAALQALRDLDSTSVFPTLQRIFSDNGPCSADLHQKALPLLTVPETEQSQQLLADVAIKDPSNDVRQAALDLVKNMHTDVAVKGLAQALSGVTDTQQVQAVVGAILGSQAVQGDSAVAPEIVSGLAQSYDRVTDASNREAIIGFLAKEDTDDAVDKLADIAKKDPDAHLRDEAVQDLSKSKNAKAAAALSEIAAPGGQ